MVKQQVAKIMKQFKCDELIAVNVLLQLAAEEGKIQTEFDNKSSNIKPGSSHRAGITTKPKGDVNNE